MVAILLGEGFEEAEALVPADLLRRAGVEVALVGIDGHAVTGGHGIQVIADLALEELDVAQLDMLVLPGGLGGLASIRMHLFALDLIRTAWARGCYLAAICAAPTLLAALGITDGRNAVCYPGMEDQMGAAQVQRNAPVVVDGQLITAAAAGTVFAFGLTLVTLLKGDAAAQEVKNAVHYRA